MNTSLDEHKRVLPHRSQQKLIKELILKNKNMIEFNVNYNLQNLNILDLTHNKLKKLREDFFLLIPNI